MPKMVTSSRRRAGRWQRANHGREAAKRISGQAADASADNRRRHSGIVVARQGAATPLRGSPPRSVALALCVLGLFATTAMYAQSEAAYKAPRTPWGEPDLQGTYSNRTITPFE